MDDACPSRREFTQTVGLGVAAVAAAAREGAGAPRGQRPNVLMITCHDLGQHLGCYGVESVVSPNLDALAARGCRFHNFLSTAPTCSPARGALLTGRYPQSNGLMGLSHAPWWWRMNEGERHLATLLRDAGYATTLVGFQHVTPGDPRKLGYQHVLSRKKDASESVQAAASLLRQAKPSDPPFFVKVGFTEVHRRGGGYQHREPELSKGVWVPPYLKPTDAVRDDLARFQADIRALDAHVGGILAALEASPVARNTLVVFTSDHGIAYPGAKWSLREPGLRVPLVLHQPGTALAGGRVLHELMSNVDFVPTLLDWLGVAIPENIQGVSFKALLQGESGEPPRRYAFAQRLSHALRDNTGRSVRTERWKLIRTFEPGRCVVYPTDAVPSRVSAHVERPRRHGTRPFAQLFDLEADPHEFRDVAGEPENAEVLADLNRRLYAWMTEVGDPILRGPLVTPYYTRAMADFQKYRPKDGRE